MAWPENEREDLAAAVTGKKGSVASSRDTADLPLASLCGPHRRNVFRAWATFVHGLRALMLETRRVQRSSIAFAPYLLFGVPMTFANYDDLR